MRRRLTIVQNRPTQFDMPLYARMQDSGEWDLQVIYTAANERETADAELGRAPRWDHVAEEADLGIYLSEDERRDPQAVANRIAAHRPGLALMCGYFPQLHARLVGPLKRRGIGVGLRSDNTLPHGDFSGLKGIAKRIVLPRWLARYDCWHPVGTLARQYLEELSMVRKPVFPFPYAVDVEWFERKSAAVRDRRTETRSRLGLAPQDFVVLGIMKWHPREDPLTLLRAFSRLRERIEYARLLLIGDGLLRDEVQRMAGEMDGAVVLPGYQPYSKLPEFYAVSDVFVHPSIDEPWGVSVQEALACGLPVLVAEAVGSRFDLLEDGMTGWTFPNGDDVVLTKHLEELAEDEDQVQRMADAGRQHAHRMDYDYTLGQFVAALERIANHD